MGRLGGRSVAVAALFASALCALPPASADFLVKKGIFQKSNVATPPDQPQSITGVGFQPRAIIFFWTRQTVLDTRENDLRAGYGFTTGPASERAIALASNNGVNPSGTGRWQSLQRCIILLSDGGNGATLPSLGAEAELTSLDPDGFTLNWTTNEARDDYIHYVALGGTDITDAVASSFQKTPGSGDNWSVTGVGFRPDFVMLLSTSDSVLDAGSAHAKANIGFAAGPTQEGTLALHARDAQSTAFGLRQTRRFQRIDRAFAELTDVNGATAETLYDLVSFDTDGFTFFRETNATAGEYVHYLALKGGHYHVGSLLKPAAPGPQQITGVGFRSQGLMLLSAGHTASTTPQNDARITLGAADLTNEGMTNWGEDSGANPVNAKERTNNIDVMLNEAPEQGLVHARASLSTFDTDGFTLDWTVVNDTSPWEYLYAAFGPSTEYRSIGTAGDYTTGTADATFGSRILNGTGTGWKTANRGRGDRITIPCDDPPACSVGEHYTIYGVNSDSRVMLSEPFRGSTGSYSHLIARKFTTLSAWEDCIDGVANGGSCAPFPGVSDSLVTDNRSEVGIAYRDSPLDGGLVIDGNVAANTDAAHTITLTTDVGNTHSGVAWDGLGSPPHVVIDNTGGSPAVRLDDDFVTVQGLEIKGGGAVGTDGILVGSLSSGANANQIILRNNLIHNVLGDGIEITDPDTILDAYNNIIYRSNSQGIQIGPGVLAATSRLRILNNTIFANPQEGVLKTAGGGSSANTVLLQNNIAHSNGGTGEFAADPLDSLDPLSSNNLASDTTASTHGSAGIDNVDNGNGTINFVSTTPGSEDLHLSAGSAALNNAADLSAVFNYDVDGGIRQVPWDIGADDVAAATAVALVSFQAQAQDSAVALSWETASELDNLGFHLYRGLSADGPWRRLDSSLIPGLGFSAEGRRYAWTDTGLASGTTYFYRLADLDRSGRLTSHGPVWATPRGGLTGPGEASGGGAGEGGGQAPRREPALAWRTHGDPARQSLRILEHSSRGLTLELVTGGFYSIPQGDGTSRLYVPGFFDHSEPGLSPVPTRRLWIDAIVGRDVRVVSVRTRDRFSVRGLRLPVAGEPSAYVASDGTYQPGWLPAKRSRGARPLFPDTLARVLETAFQGEAKKAYLELSPLRVNTATERVVLARRLVVRLAFAGRVAGETGERTRGRRPRKPRGPDAPAKLLARLVTHARGLHAMPFEDLPGAGRPIPVSSLRLSRLGQDVAFHVETRNGAFGPGTTLYFLGAGTESAYASEAVYELSLATGGARMAADVAGSVGSQTPLSYLRHESAFEIDANYLPALLEARDLWTWDYGLGGTHGRDYPFALDYPVPLAEPARLSVELQGGSNTETDPDHHVLVFLNGSLVAETRFDGMRPHSLTAELPSSLLLAGANTLRLENAGDTGSAASAVYLDRFAVEYPRAPVAASGRLEGRAPTSGLVRATGFLPGSLLVEVSGATPVWLTPAASGSELVFAAEAQKSYLAVSPEAVQRPEVRPAGPPSLREASIQADWVAIAPRELLPAVEPLVARRESQGLRAMAVALEQVQDEFGFGERSPGMIRDFLAYAYHHWTAPSPRYVLLLGDASSDPKGYLKTAARKDLLPSPLVRSTFLWTASDPSLAAVNGEDAIPDLAIGRLSAGTLAEAEAAVQKVLAFEEAGQSLNGNAVLVADNPDRAGDFEANLNDIASLLPGRQVDRIFLSQLGAGTRSAVLGAFDAGASLFSYVGHGSQALWASEAILRSIDVSLLQPQPRQPLMLTMTCSNGYFISPWLNGISERFVLEADKGAIAAFSPSGLSLDEAAHLYHRAIVAELQSGRHERLGDLVLAAQKDYADTGAFPELLALYHLFGDPALRIR